MRDRDPSYPRLDALDADDAKLYHKAPLTSIPYRLPRTLATYEFYGCACPAPRTPTTRALWLLGLVMVVMVLVQALSCGLFFCVELPVGRPRYIDLRDVFTEFRLFNVPQGGLPSLESGTPDAAPMLIPRCAAACVKQRITCCCRCLRRCWECLPKRRHRLSVTRDPATPVDRAFRLPRCLQDHPSDVSIAASAACSTERYAVLDPGQRPGVADALLRRRGVHRLRPERVPGVPGCLPVPTKGRGALRLLPVSTGPRSGPGGNRVADMQQPPVECAPWPNLLTRQAMCLVR